MNIIIVAKPHATPTSVNLDCWRMRTKLACVATVFIAFVAGAGFAGALLFANPRDRSVQEVHKLGQIVNVDLVLAEQRMLEGNGYAAIRIFDVEDHGVAADFAPVADDADSVVAGGDDAGEVDGADFKILGNGNGFFDDGRGQDSGDRDLLAGLEDVAGMAAVDAVDSFSEFGGSEIAVALQVLVGNGGDGFSAFCGVYLSGRGG